MLETGNYNSIKFKDDLRSKKPIGIYWLQSISVNLFSFKKKTDYSDKKLNDIWKYRFISSLFSLFSCLALFFLATKVFDRKTAFYSSLTLQCTLLFVIESHIAKTDAVLLTCSICSMLLLMGYYKGIFIKKFDYIFLAFWCSLGFSIMIKGPVLLLIILVTTIFIMLINIDPILSPQILHTLRSMGHGDQIVLCDINFPAHSNHSNVIRLDGVDMARAMKAILSVFPLDSFVSEAVHRMEIDDRPDEINEANQEIFDVINEVSGSHWKIGSYERQQFYKESKNTYAFITTSERRPFCNFILTKGVIKPDGTVWIIDK